MEEVKKFENRNAEFFFSQNNIRKNNFIKAKNEKELDILLRMQKLYKPLEYDNWKYELVKVVGGF